MKYRSYWNGPRREIVSAIGRRTGTTTRTQAAEAWFNLAKTLENMGELDIPQFSDLIVAIRTATIYAKHARKK